MPLERFLRLPVRADDVTRGRHSDLACHLVFEVERDYWQEEPFSGLIKDGHIWGRGAIDMKGLGIAQLMAFLLLHRQRVPLARDVVFFAMADEEAGSEYGARWIAANHPESLDAEYTLNEGGGGSTEAFGVRRPVFNIAVGGSGGRVVYPSPKASTFQFGRWRVSKLDAER